MSVYIPLDTVDESCEFDVEVSSLNFKETYVIDAVGLYSAVMTCIRNFNANHTEIATGVTCHARDADKDGPVFRRHE